MILFDSLISEAEELLSDYSPRKLKGAPWEEGDENAFIFADETAFELGGGTLPAVGGSFLTSRKIPSENQILLIGKDLKEIKGDTPFARLAFLRVDDGKMGSNTNELYSSIRKLDYVRYHVAPKGYMVRISPLNARESVKVRKQELKKGLSFSEVGNAYLNAYLKREEVLSATILFITEPSFPFEKLSALLSRGEEITKTLDHLMNKVQMDCHSCALQTVCGEVEELIQKEKAEQN